MTTGSSETAARPADARAHLAAALEPWAAAAQIGVRAWLRRRLGR